MKNKRTNRCKKKYVKRNLKRSGNKVRKECMNVTLRLVPKGVENFNIISSRYY